MKVRKIISMFLLGSIALGTFAGCGTGSESEEEQAERTVQESSDEDEPESVGMDTQETTSDSGKILVVYYSATGHTETVANVIADTAGGVTFELEPVEPYTDADLDWTNEDSRVSVEHENEEGREVALVADTVDDWETYDTVFIGYPIWWGIAAWPVDTFVKSNDFTGKTVIPFATSSSSDMGESGMLLEEMAGTGDWQEGERFQSSVSEADVQEWIEGLGLAQ